MVGVIFVDFTSPSLCICIVGVGGDGGSLVAGLIPKVNECMGAVCGVQ